MAPKLTPQRLMQQQGKAALSHAWVWMVIILLMSNTHFTDCLGLEESLTPPIGNSAYIRASAIDGELTLECTSGLSTSNTSSPGSYYEWLPLSGSATLVDASNHSLSLGSYSLNRTHDYPGSSPSSSSSSSSNCTSKLSAAWTFLNSDADRVESGHAFSIVAADVNVQSLGNVQSGNDSILWNILLMANLHQYDGTAARISYITQNAMVGGLPPNNKCLVKNQAMIVGFRATFVFWRQDLVPPKVPSALSIPTQRPVEAFFGKGIVTYKLVTPLGKKQWVEVQKHALLYDIPGGTQLGSYLATNSSYCLTIDDPNGFEVCGKQAIESAQVTTTSIPWSLFAITINKGNTAILGPFTFIQLVSTKGGLEPTYFNMHHRVYVPFTAIFWVYTS